MADGKIVNGVNLDTFDHTNPVSVLQVAVALNVLTASQRQVLDALKGAGIDEQTIASTLYVQIKKDVQAAVKAAYRIDHIAAINAMIVGDKNVSEVVAALNTRIAEINSLIEKYNEKNNAKVNTLPQMAITEKYARTESKSPRATPERIGRNWHIMARILRALNVQELQYSKHGRYTLRDSTDRDNQESVEILNPHDGTWGELKTLPKIVTTTAKSVGINSPNAWMLVGAIMPDGKKIALDKLYADHEAEYDTEYDTEYED